MVRLHLPGVKIAGPDAADALAIAICHAHHMQSAGHLEAALAKAGAKAGAKSGARVAVR
jgi:crossover junction endodeoxyribonuclease RuvC